MLLDKNNLPIFIYEDEAYSGVKKVADYVRRDMALVFGAVLPDIITGGTDDQAHAKIIFGTIGKSPLIDKYSSEGMLDISVIKDKRETYIFKVIDNEDTLFIAGSDKRGTIYGLLHLSSLLGVSPFVDWSDLKPRQLETFELTDRVNMISREPSVKYRGFFINDEWPAFGNFANKRFGGINAKLYEVIFMMLLRMNGNYLWPAMWCSCFAEDGPGLESARLADELGVVMGLSHHEPCLRHGEEYTHVRGKDSIYGDAWNFLTNREGITRFWRDGLKRNGNLENVITIGMRGERDSTIMGKDASLADNIGLLKDVIRTQNKLIQEEVNPDLTKVPRMLALYKEVEPFFFGDADNKGLMGDECLDDVILLLCDDNHGYLRSRPSSFCENDSEKSKKTGLFEPKEKNGYGLYYHFDYHGEPVSFEWVNSTYLPEVKEELTEAYETGIRELFIVNVGDVGFNEIPLNYFMDFAYDYEKWGLNGQDTDAYIEQWFEVNFGGMIESFGDTSYSPYHKLSKAFNEASRLSHRRRPEHLDERAYPAKDFSNTLSVLNKALGIISDISQLEENCVVNRDAFIQLVSYPVKASMNLILMWIYKGFNRFAAEHGMYVTNHIADILENTIETDNKLTELVHSINNGLYYGLALASHIGFKHWNDEESTYPSVERIHLFDRKSIGAFVCGSKDFTTGQYWSGKTLCIRNAVSAKICLVLCGTKRTEFKVTSDNPEILISDTAGFLDSDNIDNTYKEITVSLSDKPQNNNALQKAYKGTVHILYEDADIEVSVELSKDNVIEFMPHKFLNGFDAPGEKIKELYDVGNSTSGIKLFSINNGDNLRGYMNHDMIIGDFLKTKPALSYRSYGFNVLSDSIYKLTFTFLPCNPRKAGDLLHFCYSIENTDEDDTNTDCTKEKPRLNTLTVLKPDHVPGLSDDWRKCVITHERDVSAIIEIKSGHNILNYYPYQAENVLLKIKLTKIMTM